MKRSMAFSWGFNASYGPALHVLSVTSGRIFELVLPYEDASEAVQFSLYFSMEIRAPACQVRSGDQSIRQPGQYVSVHVKTHNPDVLQHLEDTPFFFVSEKPHWHARLAQP